MACMNNCEVVKRRRCSGQFSWIFKDFLRIYLENNGYVEKYVHIVCFIFWIAKDEKKFFVLGFLLTFAAKLRCKKLQQTIDLETERLVTLLDSRIKTIEDLSFTAYFLPRFYRYYCCCCFDKRQILCVSVYGCLRGKKSRSRYGLPKSAKIIDNVLHYFLCLSVLLTYNFGSYHDGS